MYGKANNAITFAAASSLKTALAGKRVLIVGGTSGLGRALALEAATHGGDVTVAGRTFKDAGVPNIKFISTDASSMKASAKLGAEVEPVPDVRARGPRPRVALARHPRGRRASPPPHSLSLARPSPRP